LKFLIDAQLPPALADFLKGAGHEALHVNDLGLAASDDGIIWQRALESQSVLVTKDEDFAQLSWRVKERVVVVWIRFGNCSNRVLLARLAPLLPTIVSQLEDGEILIEIK
jgi:predicted nuclease of predicted toxin-antitoxin system